MNFYKLFKIHKPIKSAEELTLRTPLWCTIWATRKPKLRDVRARRPSSCSPWGPKNAGHNWATTTWCNKGWAKALHPYSYTKPPSCPMSEDLHYLPTVTLGETQPNTGHHTVKHVTLLLPYLFSAFPIRFTYLLFNASRFIKLNSCLYT